MRSTLWARFNVNCNAEVPFAMPNRRDCSPTFHSCHVARTYSLMLSLFFDRKSSGTGR
ncbi:uncharacterized protein BDW43DRAFT_262975 [Aspergillus alliaceus]|uniref:uncharacterized protein n=1 Tax=Petromyces alliaceus TaxID=209559 RepID=UPI0012A43EFD|nr:uncharacterized protein BDW43DRAFT_262975 [Aspergillus alliaceus]KAB8238060.1 hypothetical protein BDW43DRAFT_262975 [Aspergillus alliaceus]